MGVGAICTKTYVPMPANTCRGKLSGDAFAGYQVVRDNDGRVYFEGDDVGDRYNSDWVCNSCNSRDLF